MCQDGFDQRMARLTSKHIKHLTELFPKSAEFIGNCGVALTKSLNPHMPVLAMLSVMHDRLRKELYGVLHDFSLVRIPLSVIPADGQRYRDGTIDMLHEAVLSMNMSQLTMDHLREAAGRHGVGILMQCSCGVVMGQSASVSNYYNGEHHQQMDSLRSAIDADGSRVIEVESLDLIPNDSMDLTPVERSMFAEIGKTINILAKVCPVNPSQFDSERQTQLGKLINNANCASEYYNDDGSLKRTRQSEEEKLTDYQYAIV